MGKTGGYSDVQKQIKQQKSNSFIVHTFSYLSLHILCYIFSVRVREQSKHSTISQQYDTVLHQLMFQNIPPKHRRLRRPRTTTPHTYQTRKITPHHLGNLRTRPIVVIPKKSRFHPWKTRAINRVCIYNLRVNRLNRRHNC